MPKRPARVIHLLGGLRAIDLRDDSISIVLEDHSELCRFPAPEYPALYNSLGKLGLQPVGVEFLQSVKFVDWNFFSVETGFLCQFEGREWSKVRHAAIQRGDRTTASLASKILCYIELANLRVQELASAYSKTLWASWRGELKTGHLHSNTFIRRIDGAIHASVADLAALRDALSEFIWKCILGGGAEVTRYSSFLKKGEASDNRLASEWIAAGAQGQWLGSFSNLRNDIIHAAPIGHQGAFHNFEMREVALNDKVRVPSAHFPILSSSGDVWKPEKEEAEFLSESDESLIRRELEAYRNYLNASQDALQYIHLVVEKMVGFAKQARTESGLEGEMLHITDQDIVGEVEIR